MFSFLTIFIQMDFPIHIDTIHVNMDMSTLCSKGKNYEFKYISIRVVFFIFVNSAYPDEMPHYAECKIVIIFFPVSINMCYGCYASPSW